ncbi:HNH endonuclease [Fischerella sp. JS2]
MFINSDAEFYDNIIINGISFCKNHHWAFDRSWFTVNKQ